VPFAKIFFVGNICNLISKLFKMKKLLSVAVMALFVAPFLTSCDDDEEIPAAEVVIKNEEGKVITSDTIEVKIGTGIRTEIFVTFHYTDENKKHPYDILRQYDDSVPESLILKFNEDLFVEQRSEDLYGGSGHVNSEGYGQQTYHVRTGLSTKIVHVGSIVKIEARTSETKGAVYYKVVE
jgi:hypothetical protein